MRGFEGNLQVTFEIKGFVAQNVAIAQGFVGIPTYDDTLLIRPSTEKIANLVWKGIVISSLQITDNKGQNLSKQPFQNL
jgi:hypothetical protein